jgi:hypothetical protein
MVRAHDHRDGRRRETKGFRANGAFSMKRRSNFIVGLLVGLAVIGLLLLIL